MAIVLAIEVVVHDVDGEMTDDHAEVPGRERSQGRCGPECRGIERPDDEEDQADAGKMRPEQPNDGGGIH